MSIAIHLSRPLQKTPQAGALAPQKFPELKEANFRHLDAAVGLDAPQQIWTPPRGQAMAPGGVPQKAQGMAHAIHDTSGRGGEYIRSHVKILSPPGKLLPCLKQIPVKKQKTTTTPHSI